MMAHLVKDYRVVARINSETKTPEYRHVESDGWIAYTPNILEATEFVPERDDPLSSDEYFVNVHAIVRFEREG
jgi:hypothetical protein